MDYKIISPSSEYFPSYLAYIEELGDEERYPFTLDLDFSSSEELFEILEKYTKGVDLPEGSAPNTTLWMVSGFEVIGVTNVRHMLNERIRHCGGHIGLSIRPSQRGKGLGTLLMKLSIEYLQKLGVDEIHIHCYRDNLSSALAITRNQGVLVSEINVDDKIVQRYIVK